MQIIKLCTIMLAIGSASVVYALPNLLPTPQALYGPYYTGQAPTFDFGLANTGPDNSGTTPPNMNSNWVVIDTFSDDTYPVGINADGAWLWSADNFGPVSAGSTIGVRNGSLTMTRWPENDWCAVLGNHRMKYEADFDNGVPETNEGDNTTAWQSFSVIERPSVAPDLTVVATSSLGSFILGQPIILPFTISNIGDAVATSETRALAQVDLYADGIEPHVDLIKKDYPALTVGSTTVFDFNWSNSVPGIHRVRVKYVDDRFRVDEQNECNNTSSWVTFAVIPADIEGSISTFAVESGKDISTTTYSIRNTSNIDVPPYPYRILINGVVVATGTSTDGIPDNTGWTPVTVPISWRAPIFPSTSTVSYVLEITDPTNGLEISSTSITVLPVSGPTPRLITCPGNIALFSPGATSTITARYWVNSPTYPTCSWGGFSNVTNIASWSSTNLSVATVTVSGGRKVVEALDYGQVETVVAYGGLQATTTVDITKQPIIIYIEPISNYIRSSSTVSVEVLVESGTAVNCTVVGGFSMPINIAHVGAPLSTTYGPYTTKALTSNQQIKVDCVDLTDPVNTKSEKSLIEVVPRTIEV